MSENINIIVARGIDGAIGKNGDLIWHLPGDLMRFKQITWGHPVIMGRKTWESLPKKPLPGRRNIVLTRNEDWHAEGAERVSSVSEALKITTGEEVFIIGGAEIYNAFLPKSTDILLTEVEDISKDADTFLDLDLSEWKETGRSEDFLTPSGVKFRYINFKRK